jgi:hypothetical protein
MIKYREKRKTLVGGRVEHAIVDVIFYHGYAGCGPYARVTFPDGGEYSIDQEMLAKYFDQVPDQHIELGVISAGPYDRTEHAEPGHEDKNSSIKWANPPQQ